ncbi:Protein tyrosine/serine phosphatase [Ruminococcaceae bacterium YRB3002]|nr:Protein tyrosine/serine phosphatase [Ruminococcaceae bacterium YRB3002]
MKRVKHVVSLLLILVFSVQSAACFAKQEEIPSEQTSDVTSDQTSDQTEDEPLTFIPDTGDLPIIHEYEFGGAYITIPIDDFNNLGFLYGDSVDLVFSNGFKLTDIPYYSGYYCQPGEPLLVAYPGYPYIKVTINLGNDLFDVAELTEDVTARVTLNEMAKYLGLQSARSLLYTDDRSVYPSDEIFANFRECRAGRLKKHTLYRSASPCDNQHERASYVDRLCEEAGIRYILNLADNEDKIQNYMNSDYFDSPYFESLYARGDVGLLSLSANYRDDLFKKKLGKGLMNMLGQEGPYLVHCTEGKDRTGFVIILFEMLAGATYDELVEDYMLTYFNYYAIAGFSDPEKYELIREYVFDDIIMAIVDDPSADITKADYEAAAARYLKECGLTEYQIRTLKSKLAD